MEDESHGPNGNTWDHREPWTKAPYPKEQNPKHPGGLSKGLIPFPAHQICYF